MPPENQSASATLVAGDATSPQNPPAPPATGSTSAVTPPATDGVDQLGDAGKQALDRMKAEKKAAEDARKASEASAAALQARIDELENANRSDTEKAIAAARKEATAEVEQRYQARIRQSDVRAALTAAGCVDADLAALAPEFGALKVGDNGTDGLVPAVETFKSAHPSLFAATQPFGSADAGARGSTSGDADVSPGLGRMRYAYEKSGKR